MQTKDQRIQQALKNKVLQDIQQQQLANGYQSFQRKPTTENYNPSTAHQQSRSISPIGTNDGENDGIQTFVFSLLPPEEKKRFMDFLIDNQVEFQQERSDGSYIATVKILNQQVESPPQVINGLDQMRQLKNQNQGFNGISTINQRPADPSTLLQNQIKDLNRYQSKLKQLDKDEINYEQPKSARPYTARPMQPFVPLDQLSSTAKKPKPVQTSAAQLQVYMKPEYVEFTKFLGPKNPQNIRPKRMNIQQTLRMIDEVYSFRFAQKTGQKAQMSLVEATIETLNQKLNRLKAKVDQTAFDLLASIEQHKETSQDVLYFYNFLILEDSFSVKELIFFLYIRSLAEQLLSINLLKLPSSQDIRNVYLLTSKCTKIARVYFQNAITAQSHLQHESAVLLENQAEQMANNLVEKCTQEAIESSLFMDGKVQVTFFLFHLLKEFQLQDTMELLPHEPNNGERDLLNEEQANNRTVELLSTIIQYCVNVKIDHIIKIMLEHHNTDTRNNTVLPSQTIELVNQQSKDQMEQLVSGLLQAAFNQSEETWFELLNISQSVTDIHMEQFVSVTEVISSIFENASYDENRASPVQVQNEQLEELAGLLLQVQELRTALALSVSSLLQQAKKGFDTPQKQAKSGVTKKPTTRK